MTTVVRDGRPGVVGARTMPQKKVRSPQFADRGGHVMCDRIGCTHFPKLSEMDFSGAATASRRRFLKGAPAPATITMAAGPGMLLGGPAHAAGAIKGTHGTGFCNLNIFLAHS